MVEGRHPMPVKNFEFLRFKILRYKIQDAGLTTFPARKIHMNGVPPKKQKLFFKILKYI